MIFKNRHKYPYLLFCDDCFQMSQARVKESVCPFCGGKMKRGRFSSQEEK